jgi:ATP-binding cassette, subfamily G (WHITE), member 2, SNQ2
VEQFDRVHALNPGGTSLYNGPIGPSCTTVLQYFASHGCVAEVGKNAADFIIEVGTGAITPAHESDFVNWTTTWTQSEQAKELRGMIQGLQTSPATTSMAATKSDSASYSTSTIYQARLLTMRNMRQFYRISEYTYARLYASFVHAIFNGLTFLQLDNSLFSLQAAAYSVFLILMLVPEFINGISMRFIANRNIWLNKELPSRTYGWFAFATSQIVAELPYAFAGAVVFWLIFYFMVGLPLGLPAGYVFLMTLAFHLFSTNWGQWIAAMRYVVHSIRED